MDNVYETILSQYSDSPVITQMINQWNAALDPTNLETLFLTDYWNPDTATGVGLDIWGRIVGVSRYLYIPDNVSYFGFSEGSPSYTPFNVAPFYTGVQSTKTYALVDNIFRKLIYLKAYKNICTGTIKNLNKSLMYLFGEYGTPYCIEVSPMIIQITFDFVVEAWQFAIILQSGVLPIPPGVSVSILDTSGLVINNIAIVVGN